MDQIDFTTVYWATGLVGVAFYLSSYALLQAGVVRGAGVPHTLMNMTAATLVLVSLAAEWNMSSALIQVSWISGSIWRKAISARAIVEATPITALPIKRLHK